MIRTVIFPNPKYLVEQPKDEKGRPRALNQDDVTKQLDTFIHMNDIKREQIITIDYEYSVATYTHYDKIMLVYEMDKP